MRVTLLLAVSLALAGLPCWVPAVQAAGPKPPKPTCVSVAFNTATNTVDLTIQPPTSNPPVTGYMVQAVRGATKIWPSVMKWSTNHGRVVISFPAADFASKSAGAYTFTAAAYNANGLGPYCSPGVTWALSRPAAPEVVSKTDTCAYVYLSTILPGAIVGQTGYELSITKGASTSKVEPYKIEATSTRRNLYFPAGAFPSGALSLKLAIKTALGVGAQSSAVALTRMAACETTIATLQAQVKARDTSIKTLQTSYGRCNTACKATVPERGDIVGKDVGQYQYQVYHQLAAYQLIVEALDPNDPNAGVIRLGEFDEASSTRTVHKYTNGDPCGAIPRAATVKYNCDPLACKMVVTSVTEPLSCQYLWQVSAAWAC